MQGIFIAGSRPKFLKEVRELVHEINMGTEDGYKLVFEATSMFGNEYDGSLAAMPIDTKIHFVGPDPHRNRKFYGTVIWNPTLQVGKAKEKGGWVVR